MPGKSGPSEHERSAERKRANTWRVDMWKNWETVQGCFVNVSHVLCTSFDMPAHETAGSDHSEASYRQRSAKAESDFIFAQLVHP